jgi:hypothetical protein
MRLVAHNDIRKAWLELLNAEEGVSNETGEDQPPALASPAPTRWRRFRPITRPVVGLRAASQRFERVCRQAVRVADWPLSERAMCALWLEPIRGAQRFFELVTTPQPALSLLWVADS